VKDRTAANNEAGRQNALDQNGYSGCLRNLVGALTVKNPRYLSSSAHFFANLSITSL
jgi:hypothetical protein